MLSKLTKKAFRPLGVSALWLAFAALLLVLPGNVVMAEKAVGKATNLAELKQQRKEAAHRKRRLIFNNDGNEPVFGLLGHKELTAKQLLDCRTTQLLGSQVDSIFYDTAHSFSAFTHGTKVGQVLDARMDGAWPNNVTGDLIKQGLDPLTIMVEFCKQNQIEIFWSFRMNDTHDANPAAGPLFQSRFPQFKKDHPQWLMGSKNKRPKYGQWSSVDYGRPEIRDLAVKFIAEVCENYDVDGVQMDFFRHPVFFRRHAMGRDCGQEELDQMTSMVHDVRKVTERAGLKRDRPILVAVRVPDSVGYCRAIGLDIVRWLEEDLIDILIPGGYVRLNPWQVSVELGHKYDVPVYPSLDESRMKCKWSDKSEAARIRNSLACYRARAMNVWDSGADGVCIFNVFDPRDPLWRELGDPKALETLDKVYTTGARGASYANAYLANGNRFLNRLAFCPERPLQLKPGKPATVALRVGQQVRAQEPQGMVPSVRLRLRVKNLADVGDLSVKLNGELLNGGTKAGDWLAYPVSPALVARGMNHFELALKPDTRAKPTLEDLLLWVRYKEGS